MPAEFDVSPYGAYLPDWLVRSVLAVTRRLPANWLGLRLSTPIRRIAINWLDGRPVDTTLWDARVRLYPDRNTIEKNALFTPYAMDLVEREFLASAIERAAAENRKFTFIDVGANVGFYSLFVAAKSRARARILAIEPQPGIVDRLLFNVCVNPGLAIEVVPVAVADHEGEVELVIDDRDSGGTYVNKSPTFDPGFETAKVRCRPLAAILSEAGVTAIDALKIDIEGAEDLALAPFLRGSHSPLLPRCILIEDRPSDWTVDLYRRLQEIGYSLSVRCKQNAIFTLQGTVR